MWLSCQAPTLVLHLQITIVSFIQAFCACLLPLGANLSFPILMFLGIIPGFDTPRAAVPRSEAPKADASSARRERNLRKAHQFEAIPSPWRRGGKDSNQRRSLGDGAVTRLSGRASLSDRFGWAMSTKKVLCKFFMHGACLKGEYCEFSHNWSDQANNVCTFYQKGACSYGSRCRYDHVKVSRNPTVPPPPPTSSAARRVTSTSLQLLSSSQPHTGHQTDSSNQRDQISVDVLAHSASKPAWRNDFQHDIVSDDGIDWSSNRNLLNQTSLKPADLPICSFAAAGNCPYGEGCPQMHGDLCATCGKMCLHPYRPDEREEHTKFCEKNHKRLEALKRSQEIECSVCLDRVLSKPTAAERKFGLLSECDHPFCIACIRNWRSNSPASGMDVNSALRACPICRKLSYYVIPSVLWYFSKEEKEEITESYKSKLKSIDCKYFDFGTGSCPFGTSCFYRHAYRDGRLEEVVLRHLDADDGSTVIAKDIRLSDFLSRMHL